MFDTERRAPQLPPETPTVVSPLRVGVGRSILLHPVLVLLPVLLLMGVALYIGIDRTPTYKSSARLQIGRIDVSEPGALSGFAVATQSLASAYSRALEADEVIQPLARKFEVSDKDIRGRLSATPIPDAPVFTVTATDDDERSAIALANGASDQLIRYVGDLNRSNPDSQRLLKEYNEASLVYRERLEEQRRQSRIARNQPSAAARREAATAEAAADTALLRRETLRTAYQNSQQGLSNTSLLQVLTGATSASSDESSKLQLLLFAGLLAGLFLGVGLATLRANARTRRAVPS